MKDSEIKYFLEIEEERQKKTIDLIASENVMSKECRKVLSSVLSNKYAEGYPGARYYPGNFVADEIENLCKDRALKLFGLDSSEWCVNVQPYSGSPANLAIYNALMNPGEVFMGLNLADGGHLTHGHLVSITGKFFKRVPYYLDESNLLNYENIKKLAHEVQPTLIVSGATAYSREIDFEKFREISDDVDAYHVADVSHIAGLIAAGFHKSPFQYSDVVMMTTHKTLRGPRGALIFSRKEISTDINKSVFPGIQGGPHLATIAAKAVCLLEASTQEFKDYISDVVRNSKVIASYLHSETDSVLTGGTDNHMFLLDTEKAYDLSGLKAEKALESYGILANRNSLPRDTSPFKPGGIRIGTPAITSRGFSSGESFFLAQLIHLILTGSPHEKSIRKSLSKLLKSKKL